ncbi:Phosphodiest-domain-containing protein, partial [Patellaria atrata CBS 101060]
MSDAEDEHHDGRTSLEIAQDGVELLNEEEEREKLLTEGDPTQRVLRGLFGGRNAGPCHDNEDIRIAKRERRKAERAGRGTRRRKKGELMYDMEGGPRRSDSELSRDSSESDQQRLGIIRGQKTVSFLILLFGAYKASRGSSSQAKIGPFFNGTAHFAHTTILISLDGFRADFLNRGLTPTLNGFIQEGISPKYMLPSFPSVTFPNHYTIVTGLYPESHGIVGNTFWDPKFNEEFYYTNPSGMQPKWWGGEPLWVTAEKQGIRTAIHMWPGSEAHILNVTPTYLDKYNGSEMLSAKVDRIMELLDRPGPDNLLPGEGPPRPQLLAAYVPNVDSDGHTYGPNSTEIRQTIRNVDTMLNDILLGLKDRNLTDIVNVVVVSDHGMATTDVSRLIQFEDLINPDEIEHIDGWPLYGLRPKNISNLLPIYQKLRARIKANPNIDVYLRDENMPPHYHFSNNERIAPLWIIPKTGWAVVTKKEFNVEEGLRNGDVYHPRGLHGYDFENPLMRAIFVARGPAFPHTPGSRMDNFQNIELYNIICDSLGIEPRPNNGTLRLPLKPVGLHSDPHDPTLEAPEDPQPSTSSSVVPNQTATRASPRPSLQASTAVSTSAALTSTEADMPTRPVVVAPSSKTGVEDQEPPAGDWDAWWKWFLGKVDAAKEWASAAFQGAGNEGEREG